ncbi:MAG: VWA domain-containing protein [Elusimicrobia bacterium]|nr:VWA domain-containing protein [Elusimicrobiota bacterium]
MKPALIFTAVAALSVPEILAAEPKAETPKKDAPSIEVVFVLDTTGSMGGLLEGAKRKVWSIVNDMAKGKPTPKIKMGLVAYRDRGDRYVTQVEPLSANLDAVYEKLLALKAEGGGDGPEDVLQALDDAVNKAGWSSAPRTLRIMFLVGDAPPHSDYKDIPPYPRTVQAAVIKGIKVNAIRCGGDGQTGEDWQKIARLGEGRFFSIDQSGGVQAVETPFDRSIAELQSKLDGTTLAYGAKASEARRDMARGMSFAAAAPASAMAARAEYKSKAGFAAEKDLLAAVEGGSVSLSDVKESELPDSLKGKSPAEQKALLAKVSEERTALKRRLADLAKKREKFIADKAAKTPASKDGFDVKVTETLREQAKSVGIRY